ncbi:MAG TPA: radical SAM protein [Burkholderiaceae bacterium]|nr:radical SAM protein [Burkholderiaceae bacterium]
MTFPNLHPEHLLQIDDPAQAAALFKTSIGMVEIEVFSYCNRKCWFCPNGSSVDRISANHHMPESMYLSILDQLASIDYAGTISYSRYNEPLADEIIVERIAQARARLPRALLHTNTNGDYLKPDYLARLYDAGLRGLNIQLYLANNDRYDHAKIKARAVQTLRRVPLPSRPVRDEEGVWYELGLEYRDMAIRMYGRNFELNGNSRGDSVDVKRDYTRTSPCLMPFNSVYVDYNGEMVPCCNLRSDLPEHRDVVIGSLHTQPNIFLQYTSRFASRFRHSLLNAGAKLGACANCSFALEDLNDQRLMQMDLLRATAYTRGARAPATVRKSIKLVPA